MTLIEDESTERLERANRPAAQSLAAENPPATRARRSLGRKGAFLIVLVSVMSLAGYLGLRYAIHARSWESTDDAFIDAHIVQVSPKLSGYVATVAVNDNQHVKKGEPLVKLDSRDQEAALNQAKAAMAAAESQLAAARTQLDVLRANVEQDKGELGAAQANAEYAQTNADRYESMGAGAASPQERSNAVAASNAAKATVLAAQSKVSSAQAALANGASQVATADAQVAVARTQVELAQLNLSYASIVSPDDGHVTLRSVDPGDYVQPGQALMAIVPDAVYVVANYKETQLTDMRPGQSVQIRIDAYPDRKFQGHIDSIQTGTGARFSLLPPENATGNYVKVVQRVPVKIVFDEKLPDDLVLAPGMSVVPDVKVK